MNKERIREKIEYLIHDNTWFEVTGRELDAPIGEPGDLPD